MTTIAINNPISRDSDMSRASKLGRLLGMIVGSAFSPVFPLLKWALSSTLNLDHLLASGFSPAGLLNMRSQLEALGGQVLLLQICPILAVGTLLAFAWLTLCGHFGMRCGQRILNDTYNFGRTKSHP